MATNVKILLRRGAKSEISADTLSTGELGFTTDSNQLYVGTTASSNEIVFDPFANAHSIVQTFLDEQSYPLNGLEIDEDLIIKNIPTLTHSATAFLVGSVYKIATLGSDTLKTVTAGSFVVGTVYTVLTLGTTTQAEWNTTAGTSAVTYAVGSTFTAATDGAGDGTATYVITKQEHWTNAGASSELTSGYFVVGSEYIILTTGDTDYTLIGAANDAVGTTFTATGTGIGTGTALLRQFTSTSKGTGTGTAETSGSIVLIATMRTHGITNAGYFISGKQYRIKTVDNGIGGVVTDFTWAGFSNPITAGSFVVGTMYKILTTGTTNYTLIGSADSVVGTYFTATGVGTGTGTATTRGAIGDEFTATDIGAGTGTVTTFQTITAGAFVSGNIYKIKTVGTTDFTLIGAGYSVTSGSFVIGTVYTILVPGTTDFTLIGSADSVAGTTFTATDVGTGDGTAGSFAVGTKFRATGVGTGTGTANWDVYTLFDSHIFASERKNVEVLTENSFSQVYANMHLHSTPAGGRRPDLFKKELLINDASTPLTEGTFLKYAKTDSSSFFIDYSLKQVGTSDTFVRVGTIRVINGEAITPALTGLVKLTDDNTEIWQDTGINSATAGSFVTGTRYKIVTLGTTTQAQWNTTAGTSAITYVVGTTFTATGVGVGNGTATYADNIAQSEEFSNIEFTSVIEGTHMKIKYTQDAGFTTEISYTVKRWTM